MPLAEAAKKGQKAQTMLIPHNSGLGFSADGLCLARQDMPKHLDDGIYAVGAAVEIKFHLFLCLLLTPAAVLKIFKA